MGSTCKILKASAPKQIMEVYENAGRLHFVTLRGKYIPPGCESQLSPLLFCLRLTISQAPSVFAEANGQEVVGYQFAAQISQVSRSGLCCGAKKP